VLRIYILAMAFCVLVHFTLSAVTFTGKQCGQIFVSRILYCLYCFPHRLNFCLLANIMKVGGVYDSSILCFLMPISRCVGVLQSWCLLPDVPHDGQEDHHPRAVSTASCMTTRLISLMKLRWHTRTWIS
jgi:hypothetical protein